MKTFTTNALTRRSLLTGLAAVGVLPWIACGSPASKSTSPSRAPAKLTTDGSFGSGLDSKAVAAIAASYAAETNDAVGDDALATLATDGTLNPATIKAAAASDFAQGRLFTHSGWHLSHTEGRLFTLLSRI